MILARATESPLFVLFASRARPRETSCTQGVLIEDPSLCGRRVAGENFKHRITVHVQLYYDNGLTIRWENENKIYDYKTIQGIY